MARLKDMYKNLIIPEIMKKRGFTSPMRVPRIEKIVISMGLGDTQQDNSLVEDALKGLATISGQRPAPTRAKKDVANFKVRKGIVVGCKVTLRDRRMYEFLDRLISIAIPRMRDFRGLSADTFDGRGNYSMGIREITLFPEINVDKIAKVRGMNIVIQTNARSDEEARELLKMFGMPFKV